MKVETGLRSGAAVDNAAAAATQTAGNVQNYFAQASQQAQDLTSKAVAKTTAVWNCLTRS